MKIYAPKTKSAQELREISDGVQDALVAHANVPANSRFHLFIRLERDEIVARPIVRRRDPFRRTSIIIEITLNAGRTLEIKKSALRRTSPRVWRESASGRTTS